MGKKQIRKSGAQAAKTEALIPGWPSDVPLPSWSLTPASGGFEPTKQILESYSWYSRLKEFRRNHPSWSARLDGTDPIYALPETAIVELARQTPRLGNSRQRKPLLSDLEAAVERAFLGLCKSLPVVVGVWNDRPVLYSLLATSPPPPTEDQFELLGWGRLKEAGLSKRNASYAECLRDFQAAQGEADRIRSQMLAHVGWLIFGRNAFHGQRNALRKQDAAMGWFLREAFYIPSFPLENIDPLAPRVAKEAAELIDGLVKLLRSSDLAGLATWDLPDPQGPLNSLPLALLSRILDPNALASASPSYLQVSPRTGSSIKLTDSAKLTPPPDAITGKNGHPSQYATGFRMWFVEQTARSRYADRRGLVDRLQEAFRLDLGIGVDHLKTIRKLYKHRFRTSSG